MKIHLLVPMKTYKNGGNINQDVKRFIYDTKIRIRQVEEFLVGVL